MSSFFPDGIKAWNNVIGHLPNIPSINILKGHILSLIRPVKISILNIHDPIGLQYLFYLRVGLSTLNNHKNRHGFVDTLSEKCLCNHGIEDTNHFLFPCSFFTIQRATLRASVVKILQKYNLNNSIKLVIRQSILPIIEKFFCRQLHLSKTLGASWCRCLLYRHTIVSTTYLTFGVCHNLSSFIFIVIFIFCV